jgi:glycosyltransferase involved in cell wall biosynthesis
MKIYYWSPHTSHIATIKAVYNSALSLIKYGKDKYDVTIINANGEWDHLNSIKNIKFINLSKKKYFNTFPVDGYLRSRVSYLYIFFKCFFSLKKIIDKDKPDFLFIHLITILPLFLLIFFRFDTKFILRISGYPKLNIFRKFFWKLASKRLYLVTTPTNETLNYIKSQNIFDDKKIFLLHDPVFLTKDLLLKKDIVEENFSNNNKYIISIGRLTSQKNFTLLIEAFAEIVKLYKNYKLIILGDGEQKTLLENLITKFNLKDQIFLLGFKKNIYKYINIAECSISTSLWEDPGFFLIESGILNRIIISSDCPNSPKELLMNGRSGYLFKNNSKDDLVKKFISYKKDSLDIVKNKIFLSKKNFKKFSFFNHYIEIKKIINTND